MLPKSGSKNLTTRMLAALVLAIATGSGIIALRGNLISSGQESVWAGINDFLFADISAQGNERALGLFYIVGQLFVRSMQVVIVPMVFTSIVLAIIQITDSRKLGRIALRTIFYFLITTIIAILLAVTVGTIAYRTGAFRNTTSVPTGSEGTAAQNPLMILVNAVPDNIISALGNNGGVLTVVVCAVATGLAINASKGKITILVDLIGEINLIVGRIIGFIVEKFSPIAIFCLITRSCAAYGVSNLMPALNYMLLTGATLLFVLAAGYAAFVGIAARLNPIPFMRKVARVALLGFSTSSSAATLPLGMKTATEELGVNEEIASFVLPLGTTINMDGTAIMQVVAAIFIAGSGGYNLTPADLLLICALAVIASVGTPAAPGAGAVILFTILSGAGLTNELALMTYSLVIAINRPIEMLVTALNVVGDSACGTAVARHENAMNLETYHHMG